jgi:mannosyltransferase OCH1-like enzyme
MIPKIIHYCWFGKGEFSEEIKMCIASWEKFCPDYTIKRWDETNSPMDVTWVKEAYKHQKYAFVADYVRFYALYHEGGIYMDTDMLLIQNIDRFLTNLFFLGLEDKFNASMGIIGSEKNFQFNKTCLDFYDATKFDMLHPPIITRFITPLLQQLGFIEEDKIQKLVNSIVVYSSDYFYPIHYSQEFTLSEISKYCTENTYGVHLWNKSWTTEFVLFEEKKYKDGFKMVYNRIKRTPVLSFGYYKKLIKYIFKFIFAR